MPINEESKKLTEVKSSLVANWQAAEQTLVSIGAANTRLNVNLLVVDITNLVGTITIRLYTDVNGAQRQIYAPKTTTWSIAVGDAPGVAVINSALGIANVLRVSVQSDNVADNGAAVPYTYVTEAM
jgi:hypothetical protein